MTAILAVETSTLTASVALRVGDELLIERESGVNTHAEMLLDLIDQCLEEAHISLHDLHTIAIGAGPGSFTGLRIGMATVKGLCFATGVSLTPISSLHALFHDCRAMAEPNSLMVSILDARRNEIFAAIYRDGQALGSERVLAPQDLEAMIQEQLAAGESAILFGDGASKFKAEFAHLGKILRDCRQTPSAASVAELAKTTDAATTLAATAPSYVRLPEAQIKFPNGNPGGAFSIKKKAGV